VQSEGGHLEWIGKQDGKIARFTHEPEAGFWRALGARFFSYLPIDSLI
jgi:hypothetical protein